MNPAERIEKLLTENELAIFIDCIGKARWEKVEGSESIAECREILRGVDQDKLLRLIDGIPSGKLGELASWRDLPPPEVTAS